MDKGPLTYQTGYFRQAFQDPDKMVRSMKSTMEGIEYDTLVGIGLSGSLVVPILGRALGKYWAIVRKSDNSHSGNPIEGQIGHKWLFVDDMISSGKTLRRVKEVISSITTHRRTYDPYQADYVKDPYPTQFVGSYLYEDNEYKDDEYESSY